MEKKLPYVDALRGIAILLVILVHTSQRVVGLGPDLVKLTALGQFGVQVFFVASAYTLCRSWQSRSGELDATRYFLVRRFFRIAPLYYVAILMYLLVTLIGAGENHYDAFNVLANILFVHGFVPSANNVIVPGGWSIGTEMAFYLFFPVAFGLFVKRARFDWRVTAVAAVVILLIDLGLGRWLYLHGINIDNNSFYYFNLITQLPVFFVGMTAYLIVPRGGGVEGWVSPRLVNNRLLNVAGFLVFICLTAGFFWWGRLLPKLVCPTFAGVATLFLFNILRPCTRIPEWLTRVGRVSYSMYIFHFLFAWNLADAMTGVLSTLSSPIRIFCMYITACVCTFLVAHVTERVVERPGIELGRRLIRRRRQRLDLVSTA